MFWTIVHHKIRDSFPKIPFMAAPKQVECLMTFETKLHDIITGSESSQEKYEMAIQYIQAFFMEHVSSIPQEDKIVVFPVAILFE